MAGEAKVEAQAAFDVAEKTAAEEKAATEAAHQSNLADQRKKVRQCSLFQPPLSTNISLYFSLYTLSVSLSDPPSPSPSLCLSVSLALSLSLSLSVSLSLFHPFKGCSARRSVRDGSQEGKHVELLFDSFIHTCSLLLQL